MKGRIFSIEEFSVFDGPGIRSTVFLKGCPMRCSWCHNPEGQLFEQQIVRSPNGCLGCGNCERAATVYAGVPVYTEKSIRNCPKGLLRLCGMDMDSGDLCRKLLKNKPLLADGGVTFSGGEPLAQKAFVFDCLKILRGQLHTAIQTSGYCDEETFREALRLADYFLFDLKIADEELHKQFTGVSNRQIHRNFALLADSAVPFVIRIPLIPGVTDTTENLSALARLMRDHGVGYAELLPYNPMAGGKYKMLHREYTPGFDETVPVHIPQTVFDDAGMEIRVL